MDNNRNYRIYKNVNYKFKKNIMYKKINYIYK